MTPPPGHALLLRRSVLYLPASNPRAVAKARTLPCDVVVLDLEDAVAPQGKDAAREAAVAALAAGGFAAGEVAVRVNALATPWGEADLLALSRAPARPAAVLLPKVERGADVGPVRERLGADAPPLWAMVETTRALLRLEDVAAAPGLGALVAGTNDLVRELGARPDAARAGLVGFLAQIVAAARAYGLAALDGVHNALDDPDGLALQCRQAAELGFDGKTLIHPSQIAPCNAAFTPDAAEVAQARRVVAAFALPENAGRGAIGLDGRMVERLHLEQALRVLAITAATGGAGGIAAAGMPGAGGNEAP